ncbi:NF-kappa-B essential modulator isoform X3 [Pseudophryne corroboree]|uniref:NF-kappa-B essential modulator isoform X3 n=1 Tax=Pseudophryne corroboree TaxID=495146 RepID=UPI0030815583
MSAQGQAADMVHPNESPGCSYAPLCGGSSGDESLGKPETLPPDVSNHEAFQRLWFENQDLRVALEQSNAMLRKRHGEMLDFQDTQRREREFIAYKFNEAKNLVQRLTNERHLLQDQLEAAKKQQDLTTRDDRPVKDAQTDRGLACIQRLPQEEEPAEQKSLPDLQVTPNDGRVSTEQGLRDRLKETESWNAQLKEQLQKLQNEVSDLKCQLADQGAEARRQLQQLSEEKMSVKAQVTSLLGELHESQMSLETTLKEKRKVEESLRGVQEQKQEWEVQMKQHVIQLDQRRMQVQSLESALKVERQNASEEMRKLAQLQAAYHKLFQEYDVHIKTSLQQEKRMQGTEIELHELKQQLQEAEEALVAKQELIDKLKVETDEQKGLTETVALLKAQAEIYRADFQAERKARERLHAEKEQLQEQLDRLQRERLRNESEGARARIEEMMNRHSDTLRPSLPGSYMPYSNPQAASFHPVLELQEFCCPKCQYKAPDMDTLQIHVMDCIE